MAPIVQFGTSRFLQAHVDLMLSEARAAGQDVGQVTVVETTGSPASRARVAAFAEGRPYPVHIRGRQEGRVIDEVRQVSGVAGGLSARTDFARLSGLVNRAGYLISNSADRGYDLPAKPNVTEEGWTTFPELLTLLLHERWRAGGAGVTVMPCELISRNGEKLRAIVAGLAGGAGFEPAFRCWLDGKCIFVNALVDRIVSAPIEPIGAVAEPYALWAMESQTGFTPPAMHPDILVIDDLDFIEKRKLFLLNLAHTLLAQRWQATGRRGDEAVREMVADPDVRGWLRGIMEGEIVPAFGRRAGEAADYFATCLDRFDNPFLDHRLSDVFDNHGAKVMRRALGVVRWALASGTAGRAGFGRLAEALPAVRTALEEEKTDDL